MIQLFPPTRGDTETAGAQSSSDEAQGSPADPAEIDPLAAVATEARPSRADRPWVFTNMIASADGGTAVDGLSGPLGGPADKAMFRALRGAADAILVGAATARDEQYRAPDATGEVAAQRAASGLRHRPLLVVVTRSLSLEPDLPMFADPANRPLVVTVTSAPADRRARLEPVADLIDAGDDDVDLAAALAALAGRDIRTVLCEGGPSLNGQMIDLDLIDEWNLSLSPRLLGADSRRAAVGPLPAGPPREMSLARIWTDDDFLFCRWVRADDRPTS